MVVQSWRGQESLAALVKQGYRGLLSYGYYLDLMWPASRHYAIDPMSGAAADLTPEEKKRILGGEACMWTEWVNSENMDSRVWPRVAAVAERLWSPQNVTDVESMYQRMAGLSWRLEALGLTHNWSYITGLQRMSGGTIAPLQVLGDVVEPVKDYTRISNTPEFSVKLPLNRLVDFVHPESDAARQFAGLVDRFSQTGYSDASAAAQIRALLLMWQGNDARLQPTLQRSALLKELAPISQNLTAVSAAGLEALDYLEKKSPIPASWLATQTTLMEQASKQQADLLLMVVPSIQKLVVAAGQKSGS